MTYKDLAEPFTQAFGVPPIIQARAPGRVNLLGEHVDYNDGAVLPAAIDRQVRLVAAPSPDRTVNLQALDLGESVSFALDGLLEKRDLQNNPLPGWALYPAGVAWALQEAGLPVSGLQAVYASNVPIGAGLSSSAAVEVVFGAAWRELGGWRADCMQLARLCQRAENEYVGLACGLMDQFASACGIEGHALYFDTRSLEWRPYALPPGTAIVIADSGVRRSLASSAYNDRRAACEQAVKTLQEHLPHIQSLRDISSVEFAAYSEFLPPEIRRCAEHVVKEMVRVEQALACLQGKDARLFGGLMFAGHASLRDLYQVSCPELDALVQIARSLPGVYGARLTGAGFGGCTVNLVEAKETEVFIKDLGEEYQRRTGRQARIYECRTSDGATASRV